jgi:HSP20 family protein
MEKAGWGGVSSVPAVNIQETPTAFEASLEAPGLQRDDFIIEVDNSVLTISSKKEEKHEEYDKKEKQYTRREFKYHAFSRSFTLPEAVDADKITASYQDGILAIHLPKKESTKAQLAKRIMIK